MPFNACLYLASFSRSPGGAVIRPPRRVGTKVARTPVGARVNIDECFLTDFGYTCKYLLTHHYQARSS